MPTKKSPKPSAFRPSIRSTPRAFVMRDDKLLVQEKRHPAKGNYYTLPGGKQEPGESLEDALVRECLEEIGARITVEGLIHVADVYRKKSDLSERQHQIDFIFECSVSDHYVPQLGSSPDPNQIGTCWLTIDKSEQLRPAYVTKLFSLGCTRELDVYLGPCDD